MPRTIAPEALRERLGPDLVALLEATNVPLTSCTEVTTLPSPAWARGSFLLELADGSRLKGRRCRDAERAERVCRLIGVLGDGFPRVLARRGEALLLEWIDGDPLDSAGRISSGVARRCGGMLGRIHRVSLPDLTLEETTGRALLEKLELSLARLRGAGRLDRELAERTLQLVESRCPGPVEVGIVHRDFCGENLVLDRRGKLFSIDNANLSVGPLDLDLARTWCRWPLSQDEMSHFLGGYEEHRSAKSFRRDFGFWAPFSLVMSAKARLNGQTPDWAVPIERLIELIDAADCEGPRQVSS